MLVSLRNALYDAVGENAPDARVGVAFSGGVDSALLAKICSDLGKEVVLITIGFPGSHDIDFSKSIASMLGLTQSINEIDEADFRSNLEHVRQVVKCGNTSHIENCLAYLYIASAAKQRGLNIVLSANGCDELFCGYNGYRLVYDDGPDALRKLMEEKIANEYLLVGELAEIAKEFGVTVRQPFLDTKFVSFAKTIPLEFKITGAEDMQRKHILRQVALQMGVPKESAMKPKKALQYGSLIHKNFQKAQKGLRGNSD
ncbi:MAG TPA: asparagine synthase C-terminal domain-containing protein [Nitrososphaera sp.]|nr:asparagine synthase C-terminal domain-containing protein [Nitrososphaera sp.]